MDSTRDRVSALSFFQARLPIGLLAILFVVGLSGGAALAQTPGGITSAGAITQWLVLGPFPDGALGCGVPTQDFITDGVITADEWEPELGDTISPDCGGAAACTTWSCDFA